MHEIIAVGIIKGENHKGLLVRIVFPDAAHGFSHGDKIIAAQFHKADHGIEEFRRHLKPGVGGKAHLLAAAGADVMQHEDRAETAKHGPERLGCPRIIQQFKAGFQDCGCCHGIAIHINGNS